MDSFYISLEDSSDNISPMCLKKEADGIVKGVKGTVLATPLEDPKDQRALCAADRAFDGDQQRRVFESISCQENRPLDT